jgi:hypothetical protein
MEITAAISAVAFLETQNLKANTIGHKDRPLQEILSAYDEQRKI